jgi:hypothetical protein
MENSVYEN